jgi:CBS domain-containing protein
MKVNDLMTRDVRSCSASDNLNRAAQLMWEGNCGVVPVVDQERKLIGVVTDRDACMGAYTKGLPLASIRVGDVMAKDPASCGPQDELGAAMSVMTRRVVRRLPVVDEERTVVGMLSMSDLAREAERERKSGARDLDGTQIARTLAAVSQPWCDLPPATPSRSRVGSLAARQADVEC